MSVAGAFAGAPLRLRTQPVASTPSCRSRCAWLSGIGRVVCGEPVGEITSAIGAPSEAERSEAVPMGRGEALDLSISGACAGNVGLALG